jgi:hypothetical protein
MWTRWCAAGKAKKAADNGDAIKETARNKKKRSRDAVELNPVVCCAMIQLATQKKREEKHRQFSSFVV